MSVQDAISLFGVLIGGVAAALGLRQYADSVGLRRAEWLYKLYEEFYVEDSLKSIREKLDSDRGREEIESIIRKSETQLSEAENEELIKFTDYLNFFEFMAYLKKKGAIKRDDIIDMFRYYLDCLRHSTVISSYIPTAGYEMLGSFLAEMRGSSN